MGSMYAALRKDMTLGSTKTARLSDFDETDPYYFVVKEKDQILAEGELFMIKLKLDESFLYRPIKKIAKDRTTMVATIEY